MIQKQNDRAVCMNFMQAAYRISMARAEFLPCGPCLLKTIPFLILSDGRIQGAF